MLKFTNVKNFDIAQIAKSGQCFRIKQIMEKKHTWAAVTKGHYVEIRQETPDTIYFNCTQQEFDEVWKHYFDFETNYQFYIDHIDTEDEYLTEAARTCAGMRVLKQDPWETLISFTISQNNNIKRIKESIRKMCEKLGERRTAENGAVFFEFPTPEALAAADLKEYALGYREKYIKQIAENVCDGKINLELLKNEEMTDTEAENYLKSIYGVGTKVANCILLYGFHRLDSVPKDTWINKVIKEKYNGKFPAEYYAGFAGVIQQYIFDYEARSGKEKG